MKPLTDKQIIGGIRKKDHTVLTWVYQTQFSRVEKFVLKYGGHREDAEDIFQEALVSIFRSATKGKIEFEVGFSAYLFSICRNIWWQVYRNKYFTSKEAIDDLSEVLDPQTEDQDTEIDADLFQLLIHKYLLRMDPICQELLMLFSEELSDKEIMENMGFISPAATRKKKSRCRQKLLDLIREDPSYKKFLK